ncbi:hypothetical protein [Yersinia frederiksenii]|uniref:hypothetical protein n=1 Tax=Yersinia frederiksenii TaxID=29484 RepID=UPI000BFC876A|nr:hypothetical protein [Yersinia frederiksenii]ATM86716.1 hypothetical protein CRN74_11865 [Yersinia frederiksenii]
MSIAIAAADTFPAKVVGKIMSYFSQLPVEGINSKLLVQAEGSARDIAFFKGCGYDLQSLSDSFDCDFIDMPEHVHNEDDFYQWIMDVKLN